MAKRILAREIKPGMYLNVSQPACDPEHGPDPSDCELCLVRVTKIQEGGTEPEEQDKLIFYTETHDPPVMPWEDDTITEEELKRRTVDYFLDLRQPDELVWTWTQEEADEYDKQFCGETEL